MGCQKSTHTLHKPDYLCMAEMEKKQSGEPSLAFSAPSEEPAGRPAPRLPTQHTQPWYLTSLFRALGSRTALCHNSAPPRAFYFPREPLFHVNEAHISTIRPEPAAAAQPHPREHVGKRRPSWCQLSPQTRTAGARFLKAPAAASQGSRGDRDKGCR